MSEYLQKVIYLTQGDYNTLASGTENSPQSITKNGITLTNLNDNYLYVTDGKISDVDINGVISVSHGGTGVDSLLNGQVLVGNGTDPINSIAKTSINTPNTLIERDANGDFNARNITMAQGNIGSMTLSGTTIAALTIINTSGGNGLLSYKPSGWTGVSSTQWGVGTVDIQGVIRSNNSDLLHSRAGTNSVILDVGNYKTYAYALDGSNTGAALKISTQTSAYTNQIQFMNSTTKKGSIGCDNNGITGIYAASKVVLRAALDGGTTTGLEVTTTAVYPSTAITLGTASNKWSTIYGTTFDGAILKLHQGAAANPSLSGNARIEFDYSDGQPVVISYTPNDSYRSPAGLKIMGGTSATPAWLEVEGNIYAAEFNGNLNGNATSATTASNLASITSTDAATSSATWRRLWISYNDNTTGRPAYTDNLAYQTSTNTLKTPHLLIEHASGGSAEMHITYSSTIDYWWGVDTANENHGLYDVKASKWILSAGAANTWTFVGNVTGNVSGSSGSCTGNAATATKTGNAAIWLYPENTNEINFGGTNTSTTIFLGYREKDSRTIPTKFVFGSSTGTADLQTKTVYLGSGTTSYVSSTQYTGNAATASKISAKLAATTKTYLLGTSTAITATAANVDITGDTGVYLTTTAGELSATRYSWNVSDTEKAYTVYNTTDDSIDFIFI